MLQCRQHGHGAGRVDLVRRRQRYPPMTKQRRAFHHKPAPLAWSVTVVIQRLQHAHLCLLPCVAGGKRNTPTYLLQKPSSPRHPGHLQASHEQCLLLLFQTQPKQLQLPPTHGPLERPRAPLQQPAANHARQAMEPHPASICCWARSKVVQAIVLFGAALSHLMQQLAFHHTTGTDRTRLRPLDDGQYTRASLHPSSACLRIACRRALSAWRAAHLSCTSSSLSLPTCVSLLRSLQGGRLLQGGPVRRAPSTCLQHSAPHKHLHGVA